MRISYWSSDVCSSDLDIGDRAFPVGQESLARYRPHRAQYRLVRDLVGAKLALDHVFPRSGEIHVCVSSGLAECIGKPMPPSRSDKRRGGTTCVSTCRSRVSPYH